MFYGLSILPSVALSFGVVKAETTPEIPVHKDYNLFSALAVTGITAIIFFVAYVIFDAVEILEISELIFLVRSRNRNPKTRAKFNQLKKLLQVNPYLEKI